MIIRVSCLGGAILIAATALWGCGSSEAVTPVECPAGSTSGATYVLPDGTYQLTPGAADLQMCGLTSSGQTESVEVKVNGTDVTVAPGTSAAVPLVRTGNKLCGSSSREYEYSSNGKICALDETDSVQGEVTGDGAFWVDVSFGWKEKGGVCSALTLPCSGKFSWSFDIGSFVLKAGKYAARVKEIKEDNCYTKQVDLGPTRNPVQIAIDGSTVNYCYAANACYPLSHQGNTLSYSAPSEWVGSTGCNGTETFQGEITSPTTITLLRTREAGSCQSGCRFAFLMDLTYAGP